MPAKSNYLAQRVVEHALGKVTYSRPTTVALALFVVMPGPEGTLTGEVSAASYARQSISATMLVADAVSGSSVNGGLITFPNPTEDWGTIVGFALIDALTGGNMLYYGPVTTPRPIVSGGAPFVVPAGELAMQET